MDQWFGPDGVLARKLDGYEPRPGQGEMAEAVAELLAAMGEPDDGDGDRPASCLVVEAETGLGKTLAYLVPAVLSGRRVVVSTRTRNLQDQILAREIPFIQRHVDPDLRALCVKGRQNYLCLYRYHQACSDEQGELFDGSARQRLSRWLRRTRFADRAELNWLTGASPLWQRICCQSHFCLGSDCPDAADCFLNRLRREAAASRILVVNHHLLFSDLAVRRGGYGEVLPRYEAVIMDEAHHVETVATQFFGQSFSRLQIRDLAGDLERAVRTELDRDGRETLLPKIQRLSGRMEQLAALFPRRQGRYPLDEAMAAEEAIGEARDRLLAALADLAAALEQAGGGRMPRVHAKVHV